MSSASRSSITGESIVIFLLPLLFFNVDVVAVMEQRMVATTHSEEEPPECVC